MVVFQVYRSYTWVFSGLFRCLSQKLYRQYPQVACLHCYRVLLTHLFYFIFYQAAVDAVIIAFATLPDFAIFRITCYRPEDRVKLLEKITAMHTFEVTNLDTPEGEYDFEVRAVTGAGPGTPARARATTLPEDMGPIDGENRSACLWVWVCRGFPIFLFRRMCKFPGCVILQNKLYSCQCQDVFA